MTSGLRLSSETISLCCFTVYSNGGRYTDSEPKVGYIGYVEVAPNNYGGSSKASYNNDITPSQSNSHQWTTKNSIVDKQTGGYMRSTVKESSSTGDRRYPLEGLGARMSTKPPQLSSLVTKVAILSIRWKRGVAGLIMAMVAAVEAAGQKAAATPATST
ncbi:conserved hypothetical protein [Ricinus communis]|uniref:Uncharacterized protein n=1 Tax=Ricinus communis TaxID=3988 RepID=B9SJP3_RICCO|nr:conserved hypothetical protein [Ricinus communis]